MPPTPAEDAAVPLSAPLITKGHIPLQTMRHWWLLLHALMLVHTLLH